MAGQHDWVDGHDRDSCHIVWIQFYEDLLATSGYREARHLIHRPFPDREGKGHGCGWIVAWMQPQVH
jgi:hypothetical protein